MSAELGCVSNAFFPGYIKRLQASLIRPDNPVWLEACPQRTMSVMPGSSAACLAAIRFENKRRVRQAVLDGWSANLGPVGPLGVIIVVDAWPAHDPAGGKRARKPIWPQADIACCDLLGTQDKSPYG
jgi:hypothetical protein